MTAFGASCPHCETLFKVFPDQLRLHNGFANCGACGRTFDVQAVLLTLPDHETSFLERNTPYVNGLPVLNAVARAVRRVHTPPSAVTKPPVIHNQIPANNAPTALTSVVPEPQLKPIVTTNKKEFNSETVDETLSLIPKGKLPILLFPENGTLKANEPPTAIKKSKLWVFPIFLILFLLVVVALAQPQEALALADALKQKLFQLLPIDEYIHTLKSILASMGIHG